MAHSLSAKKRVRQNEKRRLHNKAIRSAMRNAVKKVQQAVAAGNFDEARTLFNQAQKKLDRAAEKGIIHKNAAARKKSQLARLVARNDAQ